MIEQDKIIGELLSHVGVKINGGNPWDIQVKDDRMYGRVLREKNLGLGESYMDGWWECPRIDEFIYRILSGRLDHKVRGSLKLLVPLVLAALFNRQSKKRSRTVAEQHYDLGNDVFMSFLDPYNQYSCGFFKDTED